MTDSNWIPHLFYLIKDKTEPKDKILPGPAQSNTFACGYFQKNTLTLVQNRAESVDNVVGREERDLMAGDLTMQLNPDVTCGLGLREGAGGAEEHRDWRAAGRWVPLGLTPECQEALSRG